MTTANDNNRFMYEIWWTDDEEEEDHLVAIFVDEEDAEDYLDGLDEDYYYIEEAEYN